MMIQLSDMLMVATPGLDVSADTQRLYCVDKKKTIVLFYTESLFLRLNGEAKGGEISPPVMNLTGQKYAMENF